MSEINNQLQELQAKVENLEKELSKKKKEPKLLVAVIVAIIGIGGSIAGYMVNASYDRELNEEQFKQTIKIDKKNSEFTYISKAIDPRNNGFEQRKNLLFLANSGLIPENESIIRRKIQNSIVTTDNQLIFLDEEADVIGATNLMNIGISLNDSSRYQDAIKALNKSIQLDPKLKGNHESLGYAYLMTDQYKLSIKLLNHALGKKEADSSGVLILLSDAYYYSHNFDSTCQILNTIKLSPNLGKDRMEKVNYRIRKRCK